MVLLAFREASLTPQMRALLMAWIENLLKRSTLMSTNIEWRRATLSCRASVPREKLWHISTLSRSPFHSMKRLRRGRLLLMIGVARSEHFMTWIFIHLLFFWSALSSVVINENLFHMFSNYCCQNAMLHGVQNITRPVLRLFQSGHKVGKKIPEFSRLFQSHNLLFNRLSEQKVIATNCNNDLYGNR